MAKGKGIEVSILPQDVGDKLQEFYDGKQFPFVRRMDNGSFVVCVHSRPFGKNPLTAAEIAQREAKKAAERARSQAVRIAKQKATAQRKATEAREKAARAEQKHQERVKKAEDRLKALKSA